MASGARKGDRNSKELPVTLISLSDIEGNQENL
jgi:hypothetical protein